MGKCSLIKDPFVYSKFHREKSMQKCNRQLLHSAKPTRGTLRKEGKVKRGPGYLLQVHSGKLSLAAYLCGKWGFVFRATPLCKWHLLLPGLWPPGMPWIAPLLPKVLASSLIFSFWSPTHSFQFIWTEELRESAFPFHLSLPGFLQRCGLFTGVSMSNFPWSPDSLFTWTERGPFSSPVLGSRLTSP